MRLPVAAWTLAALASHPAWLLADVTITENVSAQAGGKESAGVRVTAIKGSLMRIEMSQGNDTSVVVYDFGAGEVVSLNGRKREAHVRKIGQNAHAAETSVPKDNVSSSATPTNRSDSLMGLACQEVAFTVRVEVFKGKEPVLFDTGKACVSKAAPGAQEYATLADDAATSGLVLGLSGTNPVFVALDRAETELYELLARTGGIPLRIERNIHFEGGLFAKVLNKSAGLRRSAVTQVNVAPLPSSGFTIPKGFKIISQSRIPPGERRRLSGGEEALSAGMALAVVRVLGLCSLLIGGWGVDDWPGFFRAPPRPLFLLVSALAGLAEGTLGNAGSRTGFAQVAASGTARRAWPLFLSQGAVLCLLWLLPYCDRRGILTYTGEASLRWLGLALFVAGAMIQLRAMRTLSAQYSPLVGLRPDHQLIQHGIYATVRHPIYLGLLAGLTGFVLVFRSWLAAPALLTALAFTAHRIQNEERMLGGRFGEDYEHYRRRTKRLVPYVY